MRKQSALEHGTRYNWPNFFKKLVSWGKDRKEGVEGTFGLKGITENTATLIGFDIGKTIHLEKFEKGLGYLILKNHCVFLDTKIILWLRERIS